MAIGQQLLPPLIRVKSVDALKIEVVYSLDLKPVQHLVKPNELELKVTRIVHDLKKIDSLL